MKGRPLLKTTRKISKESTPRISLPKWWCESVDEIYMEVYKDHIVLYPLSFQSTSKLAISNTGVGDVKEFLDEVIEFKINYEVKGTDLYKAYLEWCKEKGKQALGMRAFYNSILYYGAGNVIKKEKQRAVYFIGIKLKEESHPIQYPKF